MGVTYVKLKDIAPVIGTNGEKEYKMLKFSAYYRESIRLVRQIKIGGIWKQGNKLSVL
jgi:hypothetical protein